MLSVIIFNIIYWYILYGNNIYNIVILFSNFYINVEYESFDMVNKF